MSVYMKSLDVKLWFFFICDTAAEHFTSLKWHPLYVDVVGRVVTMLSTSTLSELYRASPVPEAAHVS